MAGPVEFKVPLEGRGLVRVTGADAETLLQNTISVTPKSPDVANHGVYGGLLTPQGKILFAFFVVSTGDGYLLDTDAVSLNDLIKRLTMYRLRADVAIEDVTATWHVVAVAPGSSHNALEGSIELDDPRHGDMGRRLYVLAASDDLQQRGSATDYNDLRIAHELPEPISDYALGDTFTHEANWDQTGGVDFTKGCFIGQEVVSRTRHKTVVRKRIVGIRAEAHGLLRGTTIKAGEVEIGIIGSVSSASQDALAMVRLDRALKAVEAGQPLMAAGIPVSIKADRIAEYRAGLAVDAEGPVS